MKKKRVLFLFLITFLFNNVFGAASYFLRDTEVEDVLYDLTIPLFNAAKLDADSLHIYLIANPEINAGASFGGRLFVNTGFILKAKDPSHVLGVFAHEVGHFAGGHIARSEDMLRNASAAAAAAMVLGAALGIASGRPDAAFGTATGISSMAMHSFFKYQQGEETAADSYAIMLLEKLNYSPKCLLEFLKITESYRRLSEGQSFPYFQTHPPTPERIENLRNATRSFTGTPKQLPNELISRFNRIKAKLNAFLSPPSKILSSCSSQSMLDKYSCAIALHRQGKSPQALEILNNLISDNPEDSYLIELKAQILLESGNPREAAVYYEESLTKTKTIRTGLIKIALAHALLETQDANLLKKSLKLLDEAMADEKDNSDLWHYKSIAYGRKNEHGMSALMLAEEALALGDYSRALDQAKRSIKKLPKGPARSRAIDIKILIEQSMKKK